MGSASPSSLRRRSKTENRRRGHSTGGGVGRFASFAVEQQMGEVLLHLGKLSLQYRNRAFRRRFALRLPLPFHEFPGQPSQGRAQQSHDADEDETQPTLGA